MHIKNISNASLQGFIKNESVLLFLFLGKKINVIREKAYKPIFLKQD